MPSPSTTAFPVPKSWDEFEEIVADVLRLRWNTPHVTRNGRSGQAQNGIDIYARGARAGGNYVGAQCKRVDEMSTKDVDAIVAEAEDFEPALAELLITTTVSRDAKLQEHVRKLNVRRAKGNKFPVEILFWEDFCLDLAGDKRLLAKHFPGWSKLTSDEREPEFEVKWIVDDVEGEESTVVALPEDTIDLLAIIDPYTDEEIAHLERTHEGDATKAKEFNALAKKLASDPDFQRRWRKWSASTAHYDGTKIGIAVSLEHAAAKDVLIELEFDEDIDVFSADDRLRPDEDCPLPEHPKLETERQNKRYIDPMSSLLGSSASSLFGSSTYFEDPWRHIHRAQRDYSIWAGDGRVRIRFTEFSPRRTKHFEGDSSIVIAAWVREGTRTVRWTADAANRSSTQRGELHLKIEPNKRPLERRRQTRIGEQPRISFSFVKKGDNEFAFEVQEPDANDPKEDDAE